MAHKNKRIGFQILAPEAKKVLLSGTFNEWSEICDPMKKDKSGVWKKTKMLSQGTYEYKFIIDGEWIPDPGCCDMALNQYGTLNSVIVL
jgi:1,4-alpha-glucan branching enzyme